VHPPHDDPDGDCVVARLLAEDPARGAIPWPDGFAAGVAHRLDTSTSGALWVADSVAELAWMRDLFAAKALVKTYLLVAVRDVPWDENVCQRPIGHAKRHKSRMVVQRGADTPHRGRWLEASTSFRRVRGRLFEVTMRTGVMHQIRAHAAFVGIPLAGDRIYGGGPTPPGAPEGAEFLLHHVGLVGPDCGTEPVPWPEWAR
jgi:23S rRNA pseudouridine1911/1915/1917 synthase